MSSVEGVLQDRGEAALGRVRLVRCPCVSRKTLLRDEGSGSERSGRPERLQLNDTPHNLRAKGGTVKKPKPLQFLELAKRNQKVSDRLLAAVERGNKVTSDEVLQIAKEFGFSFTQAELERALKADLAARYKAGEEHLADVVKKPRARAPQPPESACSRGCLSYTRTWHPRDR